MAQTFYPIRYTARIIIETTSPLSIGCGDKNIMTDAPVLRDVNGYPFIPGTSLSGVIRHSLESQELGNTLMGWQDPRGGEGSRLIISDAKILNSRGEVVDGLAPRDTADAVLEAYQVLPIRQHVRIGQRGSAEQRGKFDEEVVFRGTRFCFDMELIAVEDREEADFLKIIDTIGSEAFRLGGGSRKGFGSIRVISALYRKLDLSQESDLRLYLDNTSSLRDGREGFASHELKPIEGEAALHYQVSLQPVDFLIFGSGLGDSEADRVYVSEQQIVWDQEGVGSIQERTASILIPSSSVKGALSHRTAYHYNKQCGIFADRLEGSDLEKEHTGQNNKAVRLLFGGEGDSQGRNKRRGCVLFTDLFMERPDSTEDHVFNHVKTDRFTGGSVGGALFSEKAVYTNAQKIELDIFVDKQALEQEEREQVSKAITAFESALRDLCSGMLPLGGNVNKGYGRFTGSIKRNGETL